MLHVFFILYTELMLKKVKGAYSSSCDTRLRARGGAMGITCRMGSHSVTCHPTQVNAPRLNPVMWCLEALPRLEAASRQNFHCLGLGLGLD